MVRHRPASLRLVKRSLRQNILVFLARRRPPDATEQAYMRRNTLLVVLQIHLVLLLEDFATAAIRLADDYVDIASEVAFARRLLVDVERLVWLRLTKELPVKVSCRHAKDLVNFCAQIFVHPHGRSCGRLLPQGHIEGVLAPIKLVIERQFRATRRKGPVLEDLGRPNAAEFPVRALEGFQRDRMLRPGQRFLEHLSEDGVEILADLELDDLHDEPAFAVEDVARHLVRRARIP